MLLPCGNACFEKNIRSIRSIRVRFTSRVFRTRIIRIFTDVIALWYVILLEKSNPFNPLNPCSFKKVFALPTEFFSNTDYKDYHGYYCLVVMLT